MAKNLITDRIQRFVLQFPPFDRLTADELDLLVRKTEVQYHQAGVVIFNENAKTDPYFYFVRQGSVRIQHQDNTLIDLCEEGDLFGIRPLLSDEPYLASAVADEECILYAFPVEIGKRIMSENAKLALYFAAGLASGRSMPIRNNKLTQLSNIQEKSNLIEVTPIRFNNKVYQCLPTNTIQEAAQIMADNRIGSIVVCLENNFPVGIITDKDLRNQIATGIKPLSTLCEDVMSSPVRTIHSNITQAECLMHMINTSVHHLVITDDGTDLSPVLGIISHHDLLLQNSKNPAMLIKAMKRTHELDKLVHKRVIADEIVSDYIDQEVSVKLTASIITTITDTLFHQLIEKAIADLGEPPVPFAFLGLGSHGRGEQLIRTDQDHAFLYQDTDQDVKPYFLKLTQQVSDNLEKAGFEQDKAGISANNPQWCMSLSEWKSTFSKWIDSPHEEHVLMSTIFFDYRMIYGKQELVDELTDHLFHSLDKKKHLLAFMAKDAIETPPPLSFFRNLLVESSGEHKNEFDLKLRVSLPLVDAARILAIEHKLVHTNNTIERYHKLAKLEPKNASLFEEAAAAYEFVLYLRARFGFKYHSTGRYILLEDLNKLDRQTLRNIFETVKELQKILQIRFQVGLLR